MAIQPTTSTTPSPSSPPATIQHSPWHSPVPYLFGGLAAMLGLIAFALMILACSYYKLSSDFDNADEVDRDLESGNSDGDSKPENHHKASPVFEEKYLVIMAGEKKPTFLATPISSRATSFGSSSCRSDSTVSEMEMMEEKEKQGRSEEVEVSSSIGIMSPRIKSLENDLHLCLLGVHGRYGGG